MTENLLQRLEEKIMMILTEMEGLREKVEQLTQENNSLKSEKDSKDSYDKKIETRIKELLMLFDTFEVSEPAYGTNTAVPAKPMLVQG